MARLTSLALEPHQDAAVERLIDRSGQSMGMLLGLPPRTGKSVAAVEAAYRAKKQRILVISPVTIIDGWVEEIQKWWQGELPPIRNCHGRTPDSLEGWTLTNYETISGRLYVPDPQHPKTYALDWPKGWDLIIFDESVKIKSRRAQLTQAAGRLASDNPLAVRWLLSANPAPKDLSDLWTQLFIADPLNTPRSFWTFARTYCIVEQGMWGDKVVRNRPGAEELIRQDYAHCFWAPRTTPAITPVSISVVAFDMVGEQARIYQEMEQRFRATLDHMSGNEILAPNVMVQAVRLIQMASNPLLIGGPDDGAKWRALKELLKSGRLPLPTIVWTAFKATVKELAVYLEGAGFRVNSLTGDTSQKNRTKIRHAFQNGELDILLAHPGVGKFGLNLAAANSVIWLERSWQADDYYQAGFRARHIHKTSTVQVVELLASLNGEPTIDHAVHNLLMYRTDSTRKLTAADVKQAWQPVRTI